MILFVDFESLKNEIHRSGNRFCDDGMIDRDYILVNQEYNKIAKNIYESHSEICNNVFSLFPENIFCYYTLFKKYDENYLNYYHVKNTLENDYYDEVNKREERYIKDFISIFNNFSDLLEIDYEIKKDASKAVAWKILKKISNRYFAEKWEQDFKKLCTKDLKECKTEEETMEVYCNSDIFNPYDIENIGLLTHYFIYNNKTSGPCSRSFVYGFSTLYHIVYK